MTAVSIVSIAVSGMVAVAAILVAVWQQHRLFDHERGIADREAVRGVLADAAKLLHEAEYALDGASLRFTERGPAMFEDDERAKPFGVLRDTGAKFDAVVGQVKIALGPRHSATERLEEANAAYLDAYRALDMIRMEGPSVFGTPEGQDFAEFVRREHARFYAGHDNFKVAQEQFFEQAYAAAGANLPTE